MIGEKTATMLKTHLLGERYAAYCNCKKLKESKLAGSFSEVFLLLLTLMRFSPYQSGINNFCCVAPAKAIADKMKETRVWQRGGEQGEPRDEHRELDPLDGLQIHVQGWLQAGAVPMGWMDAWMDAWMCADCLPLWGSAALPGLYPVLGWFRRVESLCSKGENVTGCSEGCIYSQGISRKVNFLNWGGGRGRREGLDRDQLP